MPNLNSQLNITSQGKTIGFQNTKFYTEILDVAQDVDSSDAFIKIASFSPASKSTDKPSMKGAKFICVYNEGNQALEVMYETKAYSNGTPDTYNATVPAYMTGIIGPGEYSVLANNKQIIFNSNFSAANSSQIDDKLWTAVNSSNLYSASIAQTSGASGTGTSFTIDDGKKVKVGDILQIATSSQEYVRVISIVDDSADGDFTTATLTVERALFGGAAATNWSTGTDIYLPMWNQTANQYNKYTVVQTDSTGKYKCSNLFGDILRTGGGTDTGSLSDGAVNGSICVKFYEPGYQELGIGGINNSTNSGLTASTAYQFTINADGGTDYDLSFTTDASNLNFGGLNGVLPKIQEQLDTAYYTAGNLFEKKVTVSIVNGDVRFTSGQRLSASAIALGDSSGSDTDIWGVGRFPAVANVETAKAARLPDDEITVDGITAKNLGAFLFDDGYGVLSGPGGSGTIDYRSGAVNINAYKNAEFAVSAVTGSALGNDPQITTIDTIKARSTNPKRDGRVRVLAYN